MSWLRRLISRKKMEIDLDKELRFHFEVAGRRQNAVRHSGE